jgi:hypothetical protein
VPKGRIDLQGIPGPIKAFTVYPATGGGAP